MCQFWFLWACYCSIIKYQGKSQGYCNKHFEHFRNWCPNWNLKQVGWDFVCCFFYSHKPVVCNVSLPLTLPIRLVSHDIHPLWTFKIIQKYLWCSFVIYIVHSSYFSLYFIILFFLFYKKYLVFHNMLLICTVKSPLLLGFSSHLIIFAVTIRLC